MDHHIGREGKLNGKKSERETNHQRLWTPRIKLRATDGRVVEGWGSWVTGINEGTCCDEHWVLQANNESLNTTLKSTDILYVS